MIDIVTLQTIKRRSSFFIAATALLLSVLASNLIFVIPANAMGGQLGENQVTLNPGGGVLPDGSDGIRFTVNSDSDDTDTYDYIDNAGSDGMVYQGTYQFCCNSGSGPQLNIGGTLYGQSGAAGDNSSIASWDNIDIISTSGSAVSGSRDSDTGNGSVQLLYEVVHGGRTYSFTRTITYVYPNNYVTESYSFVIPSGNTVPVKFYLGGDTAPGSEDVGYGAMLTTPVRSLISLNPDTAMQMGIREVASSRTFNAGYSQDYITDYPVIEAGGDIGNTTDANDTEADNFHLETESHDAGLMMQWNLGSTPGTYTGSLQQFVVRQAASVNADYTPSSTTPATSSTLNLTISNDNLADTGFGLGYTLDLPEGIWFADTEADANDCGGNYEATNEYPSFSIYGVTLAPGESCTVSIRVVGEEPGTYSFTEDSLYDQSGGVTSNVDGVGLTIQEATPSFDTDKNGDGVFDTTQDNVKVIPSSGVSGKIVVLEVDDTCSINNADLKAESVNSTQDGGFNYPQGLMNFTIECADGHETTVKQYYYDVSPNSLVMRKYIPSTGAYFNIDGASVSTQSAYGHVATVGSYKLKDNGVLDLDSTPGTIKDPAGLGLVAAGVPNTGFSR